MSDVDSDLEEIPELSASPSNHRAQEHPQIGAGLGDIGQDDDRRAHHNALERKRRDHIKDSFSSLREVVPTLKGEKASRALILKKGAEYIHSMRARISEHNKDISELKRQNSVLETQVKIIESRLENTGCMRPSGFKPSSESAVRGGDQPVATARVQNVGSSSTVDDNEEPNPKRVKSAPLAE